LKRDVASRLGGIARVVRNDEVAARNRAIIPTKSLLKMYFVYILFSPTTQKFYAGQTEDLQKRLERHSKGLVSSTKKGVPWDLIKAIECASRSGAVMLESRIKKRGIKRFLEDSGM
jgi:putative endonuclease